MSARIATPGGKAPPGSASDRDVLPGSESSPHDFYENLERYFDLYNFAPVAYIRLDPQGVVGEINEAGRRMLGAATDAIVGRPLIVFMAPESRSEFLEHMRRCRSQDLVVESELSLVARNGVVVPVRAISKRSVPAQHAVYWTILIDLTESRRLDAAREHAEHERTKAQNEERLARATSEAKNRFLAMLSHELRTPLTPALFAAAMLLEPEMPPAVRRLGALIKRNIQNEARLIDDLLDISRIERGSLSFTLDVIDAHAAIRHAAEAAKVQLGQKPIRLLLNLGASRHFVNGDVDRLHQVFSNLLANAIKFTDSGRIEIHTSNDPSGSLRIAVQDTGIGFEHERVADLFRAFERPQVTSSRAGLGLGLAICKGVVAAHGGRIWAASEGPGCGATFEVELPTVAGFLKETSDRAGQTLEPQDVNNSDRHLRVLVVEDDEDTATMLRELLAHEGHEAHVVRNIHEASGQVHGHWDVVISDLGLPDGSGLDVAGYFREALPRPRLIALTGFGTDIDRSNSRDAGFEQHLAKPIDRLELRRALA